MTTKIFSILLLLCVFISIDFSQEEDSKVKSISSINSLEQRGFKIMKKTVNGKVLPDFIEENGIAKIKVKLSLKDAGVNRYSNTSQNSTEIMTEDFEGIFPTANWQLSGDPTWYKDDYNSNHGLYSVYCARGGIKSVDPESNNYPDNCKSLMVYGPFSLKESSAAELNFNFWLKSEATYDWFFYMASTNGDTFSGEGISGDSQGWDTEFINFNDVPDLGKLTGKDSVWIAFLFTSDGRTTDKGVFIDDIRLTQSDYNLFPDFIWTKDIYSWRNFYVHSGSGIYIASISDDQKSTLIDQYDNNANLLHSYTLDISTSNLVFDRNNYLYLHPTNSKSLRKYDHNFNLLWEKNVADYSSIINFDSENKILIAGDRSISEIQNEVYVTKYDSEGNLVWDSTFSFGTWTTSQVHAISLDKNNNIYVCGSLGWTFRDIFILKFDPDGKILWHKTLDGRKKLDDEGLCISVDNNNDVIISGTVNKEWVDYVRTSFIGKYNLNGDEIWTKELMTKSSIGTQIITDNDNNIYIVGDYYFGFVGPCGNFSYNPYMQKFNSNGEELWTFLPDYHGDISSIDIDASNFLYILGRRCNNGIMEGWFSKIGQKTTDINIKNRFSDLPNRFILYQNYPNPFNPTTVISYSIPKTSFVNLSVYDILGRKVITLVNDEKSLGNYEIIFNGSNLSSGIYFYSINAGDFIDTKKFILLR